MKVRLKKEGSFINIEKTASPITIPKFKILERSKLLNFHRVSVSQDTTINQDLTNKKYTTLHVKAINYLNMREHFVKLNSTTSIGSRLLQDVRRENSRIKLALLLK